MLLSAPAKGMGKAGAASGTDSDRKAKRSVLHVCLLATMFQTWCWLLVFCIDLLWSAFVCFIRQLIRQVWNDPFIAHLRVYWMRKRKEIIRILYVTGFLVFRLIFIGDNVDIWSYIDNLALSLLAAFIFELQE